MHLLIATSNPGKLREIRRILTDPAIELHSLAELPQVSEPEETGATFMENARLKARYYATHAAAAPVPWAADLITVAEDSGLVIDALDGEPGVRSARYLGVDTTYPERFAAIQAGLRQRQGEPRAARFVCALCAMAGGAVVFETSGQVEGLIADRPRGERGFGYDPIFVVPALGRTLAEATDAEKQSVSHRGTAFRALAAWLGGSRDH